MRTSLKTDPNYWVAVDVETNGLDFRDPKTKLSHIAICTSQGDHYVETADSISKKTIDLLADPSYDKIMFNAKFDIAMIEKAGLLIGGSVYDALVAARLVMQDEYILNLKHLSRKILNDPFIEEDNLKKWLRKNKKLGLTHADAPDYLIVPYALKDVRNTLALFIYLKKELDKREQWYIFTTDMQVLMLVRKMENAGVMVDIDELKAQERFIRKQFESIKREIIKEAKYDINPNSNAQVIKFVFKDDGIVPNRFSKTCKISTDELAMIEAGTERAKLILRYRQYKKALDTYITSIERNIRSKTRTVHCSFNIWGTRTGRLSCSEPNLQNLPRVEGQDNPLSNIRKVFIARHDTRLVFADFNQIELRLGAHFASEQKMIDAFLAGRNLHEETTKLVFKCDKTHPKWKEKYHIGKTMNFAIYYGVGPERLRQTLWKEHVRPTLEECYRYIETFKSVYPGVGRLFSVVITAVSEHGGIYNPYGRFLEVDPRESYVGVNYLIQSTAADITKRAMLACNSILDGSRSRILLQIHDEIVFEIHKNEKYLLPRLARAMIVKEIGTTKLAVPIDAKFSIGKSMAEKKEMDPYKYMPSVT